MSKTFKVQSFHFNILNVVGPHLGRLRCLIERTLPTQGAVGAGLKFALSVSPVVFESVGEALTRGTKADGIGGFLESCCLGSSGYET